MSEFMWNGQRIFDEVKQGVIDTMEYITERTAAHTAVLNAIRRYESGSMAEGWEPEDVRVEGPIVRGGFKNDVVDPDTGYDYPYLQEVGNRSGSISPANSARDAMDAEFPQFIPELTKRVNLS